MNNDSADVNDIVDEQSPEQAQDAELRYYADQVNKLKQQLKERTEKVSELERQVFSLKNHLTACDSNSAILTPSDSSVALERLSSYMADQDSRQAVTHLVSSLKPQFGIHGAKYYFLLGESISDGVAGFGDTPYEAMLDFNKNFNTKTR